jgi:hypothetical protein
MPHLKGVEATSVALWKGRLKPPPTQSLLIPFSKID